jgi:tetratricopeptide (TPR) repeat protein
MLKHSPTAFASCGCWLAHRSVIVPLLLMSALSGCAGLKPRGGVDQEVLLGRRLTQRGIDALDRGQVNQAEVHFTEALDCCPTNISARCRLADCLWKRGANQDAIAHLSEALARSRHQDTAMLVRLGQMRLDIGEMQQAKQLVDEALKSSPDDPGAWRLQGAIQHRERHRIQALASYQRSLALAPENLEAQLAVAEIYHELDRPGRTLATLRHVDTWLAVDEQPPRVLALKGIALHRLERYDEASEMLAIAVERDERNHALLTLLARAQYESGRYEQARHTIRDALPLGGAQENETLKHLMTQMTANQHNLTNR